MARRAGSRIIRPQPRSMVWIGWIGPTSKAAIPAASAVLQTVLNASALALRPFTIVRTRLTLWANTDQAAANEEPQLAYGMTVVKDQASTIGITALPDPVTDTDEGWFVYESMVPALQLATGVGIQAPAGVERIVDSKAQRKVGPNDDVVSVWANSSAADGAVVLVMGRFLVKLH